MTAGGSANEAARRACAMAAHAAIRAYCVAVGDPSLVREEELSAWVTDVLLRYVDGILNGNGPRETHALWVQTRKEDGWKYGALDMEAKMSPHLVSYDELPEQQKRKDEIFVQVVTVMAAALDLPMKR